jgi:hypothetical protein
MSRVRRASILLALILPGLLSVRSLAQNPTPPAHVRVGMPVPAGVEIADPPPPFSAVHGRAVGNTMREANAVARGDVKLPKRFHSFGYEDEYTPAFEPGSGDRGLWLSGAEGIYAGNDASLDLSIPDAAIGTTIYAPTHMSPGGACMETVTAHWRYTGMAVTAHGHGFWDWCASDGSTGWQVFEFMDASWVDRYVRKYRGEPRYWTQVYRSGPSSWGGLLYNFNLGRWEEKTAIAGTNISGFGQTGWSMWESHYLMDGARLCPAFPDIRTLGLQLWIDDAWTALTDTTAQDTLGPYGRCWVDGTYGFRFANRADNWLARTSKP